MEQNSPVNQPGQFGKPTSAFIGAAWAALSLSVLVYFVSLWRADMYPFEKGFFLGSFFFGIVSAVGLQKSVRDRHEGVPVTSIYLGVSWIGLAISLGMLGWGLWNSPLLPSENGLYGMTFAMAVFAVIVVQKNVRDLIAYKAQHPELYGPESTAARRQTAQRDSSERERSSREGLPREAALRSAPPPREGAQPVHSAPQG